MYCCCECADFFEDLLSSTAPTHSACIHSQGKGRVASWFTLPLGDRLDERSTVPILQPERLFLLDQSFVGARKPHGQPLRVPQLKYPPHSERPWMLGAVSRGGWGLFRAREIRAWQGHHADLDVGRDDGMSAPFPLRPPRRSFWDRKTTYITRDLVLWEHGEEQKHVPKFPEGGGQFFRRACVRHPESLDRLARGVSGRVLDFLDLGSWGRCFALGCATHVDLALPDFGIIRGQDEEAGAYSRVDVLISNTIAAAAVVLTRLGPLRRAVVLMCGRDPTTRKRASEPLRDFEFEAMRDGITFSLPLGFLHKPRLGESRQLPPRLVVEGGQLLAYLQDRLSLVFVVKPGRLEPSLDLTPPGCPQQPQGLDSRGSVPAAWFSWEAL